MNPRKAIAGLTPSKASAGKIVSVSGNRAVIVGTHGTYTAALPQGSVFAEGMQVRVENGVILGRVTDPAALKVYRV